MSESLGQTIHDKQYIFDFLMVTKPHRAIADGVSPEVVYDNVAENISKMKFIQRPEVLNRRMRKALEKIYETLMRQQPVWFLKSDAEQIQQALLCPAPTFINWPDFSHHTCSPEHRHMVNCVDCYKQSVVNQCKEAVAKSQGAA